MKAIVFSCVHLYPRGEYSKILPDGSTSALVEGVETVEWIASVIEEVRPDLVVNAGDMVHTKGYVDSLTLNAVTRCDRILQNACRDVNAVYRQLVGNHDRYMDDKPVHSLPFIDGIVSDAQAVCGSGTSESVLLLPYTKDLDAVRGAVSEHGQHVSFIVSHLDIVGCRVGSDYLMDSGVAPDDFGVHVFNGHIHVPQVLKNVVCVGSARYHNFKDYVSDIHRGLTCVESDNGNVSWSFVENPVATLFHTVEGESEEEVSESVVRFLRPESLSGRERTKRTRLRIVERGPMGLDWVPLVEPLFKSVKTVDLAPPVVDKRLDVEYDASPAEVVTAYAKSVDAKPEVVELGREVVSTLVKEGLAQPVIDFEIRSWHAENFLSLGSVDGYAFGGLTLVEAPNGVGKSSLFEIIPWALYGTTPRGVKFDEVIWREPGCPPDKKYWTRGGTLGSVTFSRGGNEYQVVRTRKHETYGDSLRVFCEGEDVTPQTMKGSKRAYEAQKMIDDLVGMGYEEFVQVVFPAGMAACFTRLKDTDRKEFLESVLQAEVYSEARKIVRAKIKGLSETLSKKRERAIYLGGGITGLEARIIDDEKRLREQEEEYDIKMVRFEKRLKELQEVVDRKSKEYEDASALAGEKRGEVRGMEKEVNASTERLRGIDGEIAKVESEIGLISSDESKYVELANSGVCPFCGKGADPESVKGRLSVLRRRKTKASNKARGLEKVREEAEASSGKLSDQLEGARREANRLTEEHLRLRAEVDRVRGSLEQIGSMISQGKDNLEAFRAIVLESKKELGLLETERASMLSEIGVLEVDVGLYEFWDKGFSAEGVRSFVVDQALEFVNSRLSYYGETLTQGKFPVRLVGTTQLKSGERSRIDIVIGDGMSYAACSSGERRRVDIAVQFALCDLVESFRGSTNLLILDEVEYGLDVDGLQVFCDVLGAMDKSIFLTTHNPSLKSNITGAGTRVMRMHKESGVAAICGGGIYES